MNEHNIAIIYNNDTASSPTVSNANQAWVDIEHPNFGGYIPSAGAGGGPIMVNVDTSANKQAVQEFINSANISQLPAVIFLEYLPSGGQKIITRVTGPSVSVQKIVDIVKAILENRFTGNATSEPTPEQYDKNRPGLPFGGGLMNIDLPPIAWIALGVVSANQALQSDRSTTGKLLFGSVAAYAFYRYQNQ
jgi:hypothetical protein